MNDKNLKELDRMLNANALGVALPDQTVLIPPEEIEEIRKKAATLDKLVEALQAPEASLFNMRDTVVRILYEAGYLNIEEE